ncbi:ATP-dependent Clp protease proteolytic subunit, partial [Streptomyces sp. NPDC004542]
MKEGSCSPPVRPRRSRRGARGARRRPRRDRWFTPEEAKEYGLIDEI